MSVKFLLLLVCVVFVVVAPLLVGVFLFTRKKRRVGATVASLYGLLIASVLVWGLLDRRSAPGRIIRDFRGEKYIDQTINDLVEDVQAAPNLAQLQPWAMDILARFQAGQLPTNSSSAWYSKDGLSVQLSPRERATFITQQWGSKMHNEEIPEVHILLSTNKTPESVAIICGGFFRADFGVIVGPPDYRLQSDNWSAANHAEIKEAKPGIYVFYEWND
ncbi:MAG TPA: hypothetical protein PKA41_03555 [Verrucomicrobiota bacterium]|nr:hypothetical protein [Verrucomicrobiota bacterium]